MNTESSLKEMAYFRNYDKINFSKAIVCNYRGYYKIGQVNVDIYDPLMLDKRTIVFNKEIDITVYPRVVALRNLSLDAKDLFGTLNSKRRTLEDRTNIINIRNYVYGDQLKNIHWKLSAKKNNLMTKEFEQTLSTKLVVLLDGSRENIVEGMTLEQEETMVSFCTSLVKQILDEGIQIKLNMNIVGALSLEGSVSNDFHKFREALTSFESNSEVGFSDYIQKNIVQTGENSGYSDNNTILITPNVSTQFLETITQRGNPVKVFTFSSNAPNSDVIMGKIIDKAVEFKFIDQIMDVNYE